ncbi:hypothetical protein ACFXPS_42855 [Nocardia sp. NPDC059091]
MPREALAVTRELDEALRELMTHPEDWLRDMAQSVADKANGHAD